MSKIICDICGTTYPETAQCCPICGCSRDSAADLLGEDLLQEDGAKAKGGRFQTKKKEIFDFDEVNNEQETYEESDEEEEDSYDKEEEEEEIPRHNTFLVILLTILIAGLLLAAGFVFVRYFLPNMGDKDASPAETVAAIVETTDAATEPTIPCDTLINGSGAVAELNEEGQHFLLHIKAMPENTTDKIIYTSADESIATVTEDGRITAVSEGETKIYISCGKSSLECPVIVRYVEETVPPTTEAVEEETIPVIEAVDADATEAAEETSAVSAAVDPNVVLKLKKTDIRLGVYYQFTLELDCDLEQNEVQWRSEHPHIATVDENGVVTAVKTGTTAIIAKYGDQEVQCMIRCV